MFMPTYVIRDRIEIVGSFIVSVCLQAVVKLLVILMSVSLFTF
jgi:hypothetical protein